MKVLTILTVLLFLGSMVHAPQHAAAMNGEEDELRVYISIDLEGVAGAVDSDQVGRGQIDYQRVRRWATEEVNAAVEGAIDAGATYVLVNDSHGSMRNVLHDELHPEAYLISGRPKPLSMVEGIDEGFDAAVFVGYHPRGGTIGGVLDHTYSSSSIHHIKVNGIDMPELGLNAMVAGYYDVPVVMVAGDQATVDQAHEILGDDLYTVAVKEGISWSAAKNMPLEKARQEIREQTRRAVENRDRFDTYELDSPYQVEMGFQVSHHADNTILVPGVERIDGRTVSFEHEHTVETFKLIRALLALAGTS